MNNKGLKFDNGEEKKKKKITQECFPYMLAIQTKSSQDPDFSLLWKLDQNISVLNTVNRIHFRSTLKNDAADVARQSL